MQEGDMIIVCCVVGQMTEIRTFLFGSTTLQHFKHPTLLCIYHLDSQW